ncbi:hypothetical protein ANCDUO_05736 [Ancylostoma duodenale]|uniref:Carboxylesterase type B domain-containing protein n=1 Tax=Ancylostoma duodenale TaxID=51022 RepID=A0A0C2GY06_9BILA|nr:hypothetical protein ANCDUO_05736 [Ancylostoma duodenale]
MTFAFVPVSADKNFFKVGPTIRIHLLKHCTILHIKGDVFERLRSRNFKKDVAAIFGTVKDEGTYWLPYYMSEYGFWFNHTISAEDPQNKALITRQVRHSKLAASWVEQSQYRQSMRAFMPYFGGSPLVEHALLHAYQHVSDRPTIPEQLRDGVGRFLGDYFFTCSLIEFADIIADNVYGPVYMYYFTMRSTANPWPKWMGVMHGYEIEYAFGQPLTRPSLYDKNYLETEQRFSEYILQLWADFSDTGVPAPYWPKYNRIERKALVLGEESTRGEHRVVVDLHGSYCRLIEEGKTVAGQVSECRARRTQPPAAISGSADGSGMSSLATDMSTFTIAVAILIRFQVLS